MAAAETHLHSDMDNDRSEGGEIYDRRSNFL